MKILTANQIAEADQATIEREPISSLALMERAAEELARWIGENTEPDQRLIFCCGKGRNGGDGVAVARLLHGAGLECVVFLAADYNQLAPETRANIDRLPKGVEVYDITSEQPDIEPSAVIVDALLGTGVAGEVRGPVASVIGWINGLPNRVISIDLPSGMTTEWDNSGRTIVRAETTLTLQFPKLSLLLSEVGECAGNVVVISIHLNQQFIYETPSPYYYITEETASELRRPRAKFSHKGTYGHALLVCGSGGMIGAATLATSGALRSGCGLVTAHIPKAERFALQANWPSAMLSLDSADCFSTVPTELERFSAIGVGPGLGQDARTVDALAGLLQQASTLKIPMLLDADALNIITANPLLAKSIPAGSVLTPHPRELQRLVGEWADDREKLAKTLELAQELKSVVVVKGAHTAICTPDGRVLFNSSGNPGMAKGGSGDVLAGYITGLLARGYTAEDACVIGVYIHGRAGDKAAEYYGEEAMNSADLTEFFE
ncbi:MAG: NAD(P)H-hydrate dehydratase [Rikenellaceae bacterium]|jgi:NAD(P)H-hydrate epimerase|nr:NAD(P)H-hydrate dehydratase [Rikenellaceae bacterium]